MCLRCKRVSKALTRDIRLSSLSDSTVLASSISICACLRWSSQKGCLNIIEIYTKLEQSFENNYEVDKGDANMEIGNFDAESIKVGSTLVSILYRPVKRRCYSRKCSPQGCTKSNDNLVSFVSLISFVLLLQLNLLNRMLLALCGDVESNPGPDSITLMTQNCRGLQDYNKLRLLIKNKNSVLNKERAVLALQETHLMNDDMIKWS
jgi:hypothetical protein